MVSGVVYVEVEERLIKVMAMLFVNQWDLMDQVCVLQYLYSIFLL